MKDGKPISQHTLTRWPELRKFIYLRAAIRNIDFDAHKAVPPAIDEQPRDVALAANQSVKR